MLMDGRGACVCVCESPRFRRQNGASLTFVAHPYDAPGRVRISKCLLCSVKLSIEKKQRAT